MQFIFSEVAALDLEATLIATAGGAGYISGGYGNQGGRSSFQSLSASKIEQSRCCPLFARSPDSLTENSTLELCAWWGWGLKILA